MSKKPNIIVILNDDMGYSDIGCYGGEADTPVLDGLAYGGLRFTQFYNSPRCSPTRASLLTGLHPHQTGVGILTENQLPDGYPGDMNRSCVTLGEVLKGSGYSTYMSGKWHVCHDWKEDKSNWPRQRGFDRFYGLIAGASSYYSPLTLTRENDNIEQEALDDKDYYLTDAISDNAVSYIQDHANGENRDNPFFMYVAYTASHWPLHAPEETIDKYKGRFDKGWDRLREERLERMIDLGLISPDWKLTDRDPTQPSWEEADRKEWEARRMEVYAAQIDVMDRGIGRIVDSLKSNGLYEDTLIIFLADNGACAEVLEPGNCPWLLDISAATEKTKDGRPVALGNDPARMPGDESSYQSYGIAWANLSNTPFRLYKHWTHEGGISTPFIVHWPGRIEEGTLRRTPAQLTDIMATVLDITGAEYPKEYKGHPILPCEGTSLMPIIKDDSGDGHSLYWEHEGNGAVREGKWKLVKKYPGTWELYDMERDRTELHDLSADYPERTAEMKGRYEAWAERCGVIPRKRILEKCGG